MRARRASTAGAAGVPRLARRSPRVALGGLLGANVVSVAGGGVSLVALPWFVLATTGSTVATGLAAVCEIVPLVGVSVVGGTVVERFGAATVRVGSDVISALTVLAIPALHASVGIAFWQLLVLMAVNGAVRAPAPAASLVLLNALAAAGAASPDRARSTYSASVRLAGAVSAPLGGVLIAWKGAPVALVVDAASFAVSAVVLAATLRLRRAAVTPRASMTPPERLWSGLASLAQDRLLGPLCMLVVVLAVLEGAWGSVLAPAYGQRVLHSPTALGVLLGVFAVGALAGNLAYPWAATRIDHHLLVWTSLAVATALRFGTLGSTQVLPVLAAAILPAGIALGLLGPLWLRLLTERTRPQLHGHVFGVTFALEQGATALGALIGGLMLTRVSISASLTIAALVGGALALLAASAPPLRELHRTTATPHSPQAH